jgi:uncharacterized protein YicC (UPF0701 family)
MRSMTGYGRASAPLGAQTLTAQINSVNRRGLDLTVRLPREWESLEAEVTEAVRKVALRGKVQVDFEVTAPGSGEEIAWDAAGVPATLAKLAELAKSQGIAFQPTPELLWQIASSRRQAAGLPAPEAARAAVQATLAEALQGFAAMRTKEGASLLTDFLARVGAIRQMVEAVATRSPLVVPGYREALHKRLREAGLEIDVSDERVLKEIALFADRCDTSEEITRLRSHLDQFGQWLASDGEIGRKAEFMLQEMGREVHTLGSKANDLAISRYVIELKNELERVKEQVANVE